MPDCKRKRYFFRKKVQEKYLSTVARKGLGQHRDVRDADDGKLPRLCNGKVNQPTGLLVGLGLAPRANEAVVIAVIDVVTGLEVARP